MYFTIWAPRHIFPEVTKGLGNYNIVDPDPTGKVLKTCISFSQERFAFEKTRWKVP